MYASRSPWCRIYIFRIDGVVRFYSFHIPYFQMLSHLLSQQFNWFVFGFIPVSNRVLLSEEFNRSATCERTTCFVLCDAKAYTLHTRAHSFCFVWACVCVYDCSPSSVHYFPIAWVNNGECVFSFLHFNPIGFPRIFFFSLSVSNASASKTSIIRLMPNVLPA